MQLDAHLGLNTLWVWLILMQSDYKKQMLATNALGHTDSYCVLKSIVA